MHGKSTTNVVKNTVILTEMPLGRQK